MGAAARKTKDDAPNSIGRPTLYRPEMCEEIIDLGKQGYSKAEMAAHLGVVRDTLHEWSRVHRAFSDAMTRAMEFSLAWWEAQGRTNLSAPTFQANLYGKSMAARFPGEPWRNQLALTGPNGGALQIERTPIDLRNLAPEQRELFRQLLIEAAGRLDEPDVIEGEFSEGDSD